MEEVSVAQFAQGHPVWHRSGNPVGFDGEEVIRRARSRLGEDRYRVLTNNCEHFCEWCVRGRIVVTRCRSSGRDRDGC